MQERKVTAPLAAVVDGCVISETLGVRKPDPAILVAAAKSVERALTPDAWMIGDRAEVDIWCAARARIRSAWISRGARWDDRLAYRPTIQSSSTAAALERILALG
jgi:FMN phosphatase YigB (HAD superfamily)